MNANEGGGGGEKGNCGCIFLLSNSVIINVSSFVHTFITCLLSMDYIPDIFRDRKYRANKALTLRKSPLKWEVLEIREQ